MLFTSLIVQLLPVLTISTTPVFMHAFDSMCLYAHVLCLLTFYLQGIKDGWYDGGSIALAFIIVILVFMDQLPQTNSLQTEGFLSEQLGHLQ